jgi:DNA-binding GntR family transcriptional regulator
MAEYVRQVLSKDILQGRLKPGERLTEESVAKRTGVSRTPVREGLRLLESEGLVVTRRSRGSYVAALLSNEEMFTLYEARLVIEPYLTARAAVRTTAEGLDVIRSALERFTDRIREAANMLELSEMDATFHRAIYAASGSDLAGLFDLYWNRLHSSLSEVIYSAEDPQHFQSEHMEIFKALSSGDSELSRSRMYDHIRHGQEILRREWQGAALRSRSVSS